VKPKGKKLRMGLAGLGAASTHILRALDAYDNMEVTAACDVRGEARVAFEAHRGGKAFASVKGMAKSDNVDESTALADYRMIYGSGDIALGRLR
jgi:hypothetical protein